jgi:hypothetical protein
VNLVILLTKKILICINVGTHGIKGIVFFTVYIDWRVIEVVADVCLFLRFLFSLNSQEPLAKSPEQKQGSALSSK